MSPKISSLAAGLTALGLFWSSSRGVAAPEDPPEPMPVPVPAATPPAAPSPPTVLLLSNGHVFQGEVLEDGTGYHLKHKIGVMHFTRRNVAGTFRSMDEVYQYKLARLPKNDPDERMKLALWCLEQKMDAPAKEQLQAVLALSPDNRRAKAMLFHLDSKGGPLTDAAIARTSAEMETGPETPRPLNRNLLEELREANHQRPSGPPIIFNLTTSMAVRRYQEFARYVHAELQNRCAKCHDENFAGEFRLVRARTRRDLANELLIRTNLDATLRLVEPTNLAHSPLLTAAAMTHPPDGRPILGGPNHPAYRILADWVNGLQDANTAAPSTGNVAPARFVPQSADPNPSTSADGFAVGRLQPPAPPSSPIMPVTRSPLPQAGAPQMAAPNTVVGRDGQTVPIAPPLPGQAVPNSHNGRSFTPPPGTQFYDSPLSGGPNPSPVVVNGKSYQIDPNTAQPVVTQDPASTENPPGTPGSPQVIRLPNGQVLPFVSADTMKSEPPAPEKPAEPSAKKAPKIDPNALQKFITGRAAPK